MITKKKSNFTYKIIRKYL